jgi:AAA+ superfamily predicted ATPase
MRTTIQGEKLKHLFQAYRDHDDSAFLRAAEAIISEELAANHYSSATDLQRALRKGKEPMDNGAKVTQLTRIPPKDRRNGEDLLWFVDAQRPPVIFFSSAAEKKIARVLDEHRRGSLLRKHGYAPKSKFLFWGPPGCGKTLTARYLAAELGLPLGIVRLDAVISSFLGDTASHLHRIFSQANNTPMVLLLDEADALAKQRDDPNDVGELKRVVNSFLQGMDGFSGTQSILIAASNHQYLFDPALWRRFDDVIEFAPPEASKREAFIKTLLNGIRFQGSHREAVRKMASLSYSDIQHVVIETIKTMLLTESDTLQTKDLLAEIHTWKTSVQKARKRNGAARK